MTQLQPVKKTAHNQMYPGMALGLVLTGAGLGALGYHMVAGHFISHGGAPATDQSAPQFVAEGKRIVVPEGSPLRNKLAIDVVADKEVQRNLVLPAVVEADPARLVKVLPPLSGRITQLKVQLGEEVEQGQPLVVLDSPDLAAAYADYEKAKAIWALAIKNRNRLRDLAKTGGAATKDQQQAETDYVTAEVENQRAEARLRQIGVDPETATKSRTVAISAPVSGSIIDLAVAPGAYWNDSTAALMTVADLSTIWVTANVPEKDTSLVAKGQPVDIAFAAYPGELFKSDVLFVSNVLDPDTRRTKVRIRLPNAATRLKPGMFANVTFFTSKLTVPIVPTTALVLKDEASQVFVEVAPWSFEARRIDVGFEHNDDAIVRSGLKAGERIVTKGGVLLND